MKKLILFSAAMILLYVGCKENKEIDSPIVGEYGFGFLQPESVHLGLLVFNKDGSMENGPMDKNEYSYEFKNDSILTIIKSYNGGKTEETNFVLMTEPDDTIFLKMKSKIRYMGGDAPSFMKKHTNVVPIVEYDSQSDSTLVVAYLVKKTVSC